MLKATLLAIVLAMTMVTFHAPLAHAGDGDDVFLDEGDGDFAAPTAPAPQAEAPAPVDSSPMGEEPAAPPSSTLVEEATGDSSMPSPAEMPEKPAKKSKKAVKPAVAKKAPKSHKVAKSKPGRGYFVTTKEACPMMREPASEGSQMITVRASKKIWVEEVDETWVRGFNKAGEPGYISRDCVSK